MNRAIFIIFWTLLALTSCSSGKTKSEEKAIDTVPVLVTQIQKCSRLYTAEVHVHKVITYDDQLKLQGTFLKKDFNITVPGSNRKVAIPLDATVKAYIDFQDFSAANINRHGEQIEIILPDPKMTLTGTKIDHKGIKQFVSFTRSNFSDAELSRLEQQGRESIVRDLPSLDIQEQARQSAANTLIPMIKEMGFKEDNIKVTFRKKFTLDDFKTLLDGTTTEKKK